MQISRSNMKRGVITLSLTEGKIPGDVLHEVHGILYLLYDLDSVPVPSLPFFLFVRVNADFALAINATLIYFL